MEQAVQKPRRSIWAMFVNFLVGGSIIVMAVVAIATIGPDLLVTYNIVSPETMAKILHLGPQATATPGTSGEKRAITITTGGGSGGGTTYTSGGGSRPAPLPDCSTVTDTKTACQGQPQTVEEAQPTPTLVYCEDVLPGPGIAPCQWRDEEAARRLQEHTEQEALELWQNMADQAIEQDLRAPPTTPTAEVPTECSNPPNARAVAACELIRRGIIHPKG